MSNEHSHSSTCDMGHRVVNIITLAVLAAGAATAVVMMVIGK